MKQIFSKILLCVLFISSLQFAMAEEIRSGLLLVGHKNPKRTKVIPINTNVKIWAGEDNKVYYAKILAVDKEFAYLSLGVSIPIRSINCIRRNRIMLHDVGDAAVATGAWAFEGENRRGIFEDSHSTYDSSPGDPSLLTQLVFPVISAVGAGVAYLTAGVAVGIFEPRYSSKKWDIQPLNPEGEVIFYNYLQNERRK